MKVGLVRHFEVEHQLPNKLKWMTPVQFEQWLHTYEISDIKDGNVDFCAIPWEKCYSSDLPRALKTAHKLFNGQIIPTKTLRELVMYPPTKRNIKLPIILWLILGRLAWMLSHPSQLETKPMFKKRLQYVTEEFILKENANILIVSHGALLMYLRKELIRQGFKGPNFKIADNGRIYVFEK